MNINGREIGPGQPPYIIAEASCNHGGSLQVCFDLIRKAKEAGADAIKFQCYSADTITMDSKRPEFMIKDGPWKGKNLYELYCETETPRHWFPQIKAWADEVGITWFASVFDKTSVDLMVELGAPAIKIASFEIIDTPLIKYAAETRKPLIISTGMANDAEITAAVRECREFAVLHCVSGYPTPVEDANLERFREFNIKALHAGISDHTIGDIVPITATALGAEIIEKHFRVPHVHSYDMDFSMTPYAFLQMARAVRQAWSAMQPSLSAAEDAHRPLRRSLFAVEDIHKGELFTEKNVRSIRPGDGMSPARLSEVLGRRAVCPIARGMPLQPWFVFEEMSNGVAEAQ